MTTKPSKKIVTRGGVLLLFVMGFLITSLVLVISLGRGVYEDLVRYRILEAGKKGIAAAESGLEDAVHRHKDGDAYSGTETFLVGSSTVTVRRTTGTDYFTFISEGVMNTSVRTSYLRLDLGAGVSFNFGLQAGNGGIVMSNNSKVYGNVFANGTVEGQGNATVYGEVVSAGGSGFIDSVHATGSAWAHSIDNSTIDGNAYYFATSTRSATIVGGLSFPGTADQPTSSLPIEDSQIEDWKNNIINTGTAIASTSAQCAGGTYVINTHTTLGNVKIDCNVEVRKQGASTILTLTDLIWVSGNLTFTSGPTIVASSSLGSKSVAIIVDKESNRATSSKISVNQSTQFNSSNASSYVLLLSMNNHAENGGTTKAIDLSQSANGRVLVYAGHGLVDMGNSISLKEVTGHTIEISNGAEVIYESGLMSLLFTSGPGGGYSIGAWRETE